MFSTKSSSRRGSSSEKKQSEPTRRRTVSSKDMQVTFENIIHHVSKQQSDALDKESVVRMVKSVYNWMVFDSSMQIDLPSEFGSNAVAKMWPHGAKVDTRRKSVAEYGKGSSRKLKDVKGDDIINIASSVVSSTLEEEQAMRSKGQVMFDMPRSTFYESGDYPGVGTNKQYGQNYYASGIPGGPPMGFSSQQRSTRIVPEGFQPSSSVPRGIPRYSVVGGAPPPRRVDETPELQTADIYPKKKGKKPKMGAAKRNDAWEENGIPVNFED